MTYDREEDILYLAHQLWEEQAASHVSVRSCWQEAASEVLSHGRARYAGQKIAHGADEKTNHPNVCIQFGSSPLIEMGKILSTYRVEMITHRPQAKIANPAIFLVRSNDLN